ncbi:hypothetical protein AOC36_02115 [Erysipelothrix larvae]|uniref:Cell shape determination protein CcmA n=1 Tax=Erysipelothrix larvae TaxID=1514105 RepID=A0A109UGK9_9FIRM|nr:polymer-forming cytoskeletal protein [Erysipelothrix larvae]AMC92821.1 hypothetical protein AOC36_02115 [Erysipelothrix larvae]
MENNKGFNLDENYSVISSGVTIRGNIESKDSLSIAGIVEGDVYCEKEIELAQNCTIHGDIKSASIAINGAEIRGNVSVEDRFVLDKDSIIVGSLSANSARINGRIDGPVKVSGEVSIASTAVVIGDLMSSSLVVENGAQLKGSYTVYVEEVHEEADAYMQSNVDEIVIEHYYQAHDFTMPEETQPVEAVSEASVNQESYAQEDQNTNNEQFEG